MEPYKNSPLMWQVNSVEGIFECINAQSDAVLITMPQPDLQSADWQGLGKSIAPCAGYHRPEMQNPTIGAVRQQMLEELASFGVSSNHPLFLVMLENFCTVYERALVHFGDNMHIGLKGALCYITNGYEEHNSYKEKGKLSHLHSDLPDWRIVCTYVGNRGTQFVSPAEVEAWYQAQSSDYPIWLAEPADNATVHEMEPLSINVYRGGPTPGRIPSYKGGNYVPDMHQRLPHASPVLKAGDDEIRLYMGANIYLKA